MYLYSQCGKPYHACTLEHTLACTFTHARMHTHVHARTPCFRELTHGEICVLQPKDLLPLSGNMCIPLICLAFNKNLNVKGRSRFSV